MKSVTVAGIDCGTNSIRLKVSRVSEDGVEDIVPAHPAGDRLGQDVDKTHRFADEALARAYEAARESPACLPEHPVDGIRFVATSATVMPRTVRNSKTTSRRSWACVLKSFQARRKRI